MTNQDEAERIRHDLIEQRAYAIYEARGGRHGFDHEDWDQAEREIDGLPIDDDRLPDSDEDESATGQTGSV